MAFGLVRVCERMGTGRGSGEGGDGEEGDNEADDEDFGMVR